MTSNQQKFKMISTCAKLIKWLKVINLYPEVYLTRSKEQ